MSCSLYWEGRGLRRLFSGVVTGDEILQSNLEVQGAEDFDQLLYMVSDFVDVTEFELTERDIATIANIDQVAAKSNANIRIAIVVHHDSLRVWANLYVDKMRDCPFECEIFNDLHHANKWAREFV